MVNLAAALHEMKKWLHTNNAFGLLTFLVATSVLFFFYAEVLLAPNDYLCAPDGDGIKNYYTYLYHAKYDASFSTFTGMNYPYNEHIVYTDAHPFLSWLIGALGLADYGIGILNILMLISYPIAALILFAILKHYNVSNWWALSAAVAIAFLSPQAYRILGHLSLSYIFAVPLMWWLLIQFYSSGKQVWSFLIVPYLLFFFLTHPYLGIILAFLSLFFWIVNGIAKKRSWKKVALNIGVQIALPFSLFRGYVWLTDEHLNRLSNPAGFFDYYASWKSLLVAHDGPLSGIYSRLRINIGNWESWNYIGFPTLIFALIIGGYLIKNRKSIHLKTWFRQELVLFFLAAYLVLLFSFCFPLKYSWLRWITESFGSLKQFRVLGRFAWVFYYVFTVACAVGIYRIYQHNKNKIFPFLFLGGIVFYVLEFYPVHQRVASLVSREKNQFKIENVDPELREIIHQVNEGGYTSILFLPFQHMSSESIMILAAEEANKAALILSYHTNLPLINSISSRMSLDEAKKANNYFAPPFIEKQMTYDFLENEKIALIRNRDLLENYELKMVWESEEIYKNSIYTMFDFDHKKWNSKTHFNKILKREKRANQHNGNGWFSDTSNVWYYYESYNDLTDIDSDQILSGAGAYKGEKQGWNILLELTNKELKPADYVLRFWYNLKVDRPDVSAIIEEAYLDEAKKTEWISSFDVKQPTLVVEDWALVELYFTVAPDMKTIKVMLTGRDSKYPFVIDELLLQKSNNQHLFRKDTLQGIPYIIYDNQWIKEASFSN